MARSRRAPRDEIENAPTFWFQQLIAANEVGDQLSAWAAQKALHRLGFVVTLRRGWKLKGGDQ